MSSGSAPVPAGDPASDPVFVPPPAPRRKWPWLLGVPLVALALVLAGLRLLGSDDSCATGGTKAGPRDECIAVSDGSYVFEESLTTVMGKIEEENERVEKSGQKWVSVAMVQPITTDRDREALEHDLREELEGAYLAQLRLNDSQLSGRGELPQIRLLVANVGLRSEQWEPLADRLIAMTHDRNNLVAVAGFGQSRGGTLDLVDALREAGVPMMGATVTADNLASKAEVGFFRISASNAEQASAAVGYLKEQQRGDPDYDVMVIRDRNGDDIYNTSLYEDFRAAAKAQHLTVAEGGPEYVSGIDGVSNAFSSVADRVCDKQPEAVYFAGRGVNLRNFITAMSAADRRCRVTVLTADDAVSVYYDPSVGEAVTAKFSSNWAVSRVTVLYTALGHPRLPAELYEPDKNPFTDFRALYRDKFEQTGEDVFQDGQAILAHDSVWVLGVAIRAAAGDSGTAPVTTGSVLNQLVSADSVNGVSGPITLGSDGNPTHKAMALVQLQPDRTFDYQRIIWPGGADPGPRP